MCLTTDNTDCDGAVSPVYIQDVDTGCEGAESPLSGSGVQCSIVTMLGALSSIQDTSMSASEPSRLVTDPLVASFATFLLAVSASIRYLTKDNVFKAMGFLLYQS